MVARPINRSLRVGEDFETLAAGTYTLYNRSGKPQTCARRIMVLADGSLTMLKNSGEVDSPPGAVTAGMVFDADFSAVTCTAAIWVAW
jgi:hypothetical protein